MIQITRCPECGTRFTVTETQLDAHEGLVRCGRCHEVFDASEHLHDDEPSPQLDLLIEPNPSPDAVDLTPIPNVPGLEEEPTTLAQQVRFVEELTDEVLDFPSQKGRWIGMLAGLLLSLILIAQATYYFRDEIGARLPGLKPLLARYCSLLACSVALPRQSELIVIESSELASDPNQANFITLHVLIHNHAPYTQAYPSIELTLTDLQDQMVARRVFQPKDYLKAEEDGKMGIPANRDFDVKLHLDTTDLKPSGYRLFLFYSN